MPRNCRVRILRRFGLMLGLLVLLPGEANADLPVSNIGLYDGTSNAPVVQIKFTGSTGLWIYADPQTATDANWQSNGHPIPLYCIDTVHDNNLGSSYKVNVEPSPPVFSTTPANPAAANEVAWAIENAGNSVNARAATQLFIWSVIDQNFSVANWGNNTSTGQGSFRATYNALVALTGYNPTVNYLPGTKFLSAVHVGSMYQDLAFAPPGTFTPLAVPEPSTLAIACLGSLGLIGYGCRRARSRVGAVSCGAW